jgi:hypothetical protein
VYDGFLDVSFAEEQIRSVRALALPILIAFPLRIYWDGFRAQSVPTAGNRMDVTNS